MISYNAHLYNGDDEPITKSARRICENLRCEIRKNMNTIGDRKSSKEEFKFDYSKPIGKLTAPTRLDASMSTFDVF
jgi:hypothetical protein